MRRSIRLLLPMLLIGFLPTNGEAAKATPCEAFCAGGWASCRTGSYLVKYSADFCDGWLHGCLIGCDL